MPSLAPDRLRQFALDALEEALADADLGPVRRTWSLRLALAYLASLHPRIWSSSEPYRDFWRALSLEGRSARRRALEQALATIYSWVEVKRDSARVTLLRERAQADALERRRCERRRD